MTRVQGVRLQNNIAIVLQHKYGYALGGCLAAEGKMAGRITWRALGLVCRTRYISFRTMEFISFWGLTLKAVL
jgi:hypothetical protein